MKWYEVRTLASARAKEFFDQLPGIRDGVPDSVHAARVAGRRLRELLPLLADEQTATRAKAALADLGRRLGSVRDLDVMIALLTEKEMVVPAAALAIAAARRQLRTRVERERRRLAKTLNHLELDPVAALRTHSARSPWHSLRPLLPGNAAFAPVLRDRIGLRSDRLRTSVHHAGGLYFPHRLHATRKAIKKLRYAVEVAKDLGLWSPPHMLADLRKLQAILGTLRDAAVLRDTLDSPIDGAVPRDEQATLVNVLDADVRRAHREYLSRRDRLLAIADACDRFVTRRSRVRIPVGTVLTLVHKAS